MGAGAAAWAAGAGAEAALAGAGAGGVTFFSLSMASAAPRFGAMAAGFGAGAGAVAVAGVGAEGAGAAAGTGEGVFDGAFGAGAVDAGKAEDEGITTEGDDDAAVGMGVEGANEGAGGFDSGAALEGCPIDARILDISWSFTSFAMATACSAFTFRPAARYEAKSCGSVSPRISSPVSASRSDIWSICSLCFPPISLIAADISAL